MFVPYFQVLQAKFDDFKHRVEAGSERFNQCEDLAKKLIANESPYAAEIDRKKDSLGFVFNFFLIFFSFYSNLNIIRCF